MSFARDRQTVPAWEQIHRTRRWYMRLIGLPDDTDADARMDFVLAVFQNCFAVRDWMKVSGVEESHADTRFKATVELRLCRDICNGSKHCTIKWPSVDPQHMMVREYVPGGVGESPTDRLVVLADGEYHDPYALAKKCLDQIEAIAEEELPRGSETK